MKIMFKTLMITTILALTFALVIDISTGSYPGAAINAILGGNLKPN